MKNMNVPEVIAAGIYDAKPIFKSRTVTPSRTTTMFEIELPLEDGGTSFVNNSSHRIKSNLIISAKPGQRRHTKLPFRCYYVHMIVKDGALLDILSSLPDYMEIKDGNALGEIKDIFISIFEYYNRGTPSENIMLASLLLKLIYRLNKEAAAQKSEYLPKPSNREVIEQTVRYIKENITEDLSLSALSKIANFTPVYFHRLFRASTGKNLRNYVEEIRIKKAIELLISTDKTLTEIAYECGFSSQSYFSYAFKKRAGIPPREYAKTAQLRYEQKPE